MRGEEGGIRGVVGAIESDQEGVGVSETTGVSDLIVDVDGLCFSSGEAVVGVVGGIKGPGTIGVDGQTSNASGGSIDGDAIRASDGGRSEGEGGGFGITGTVSSLLVDVSGSQLTGDGAVALCGELIRREGRLRGVVDGNDIEADGV